MRFISIRPNPQTNQDRTPQKMLYLVSENVTKKWTQRYRGGTRCWTSWSYCTGKGWPSIYKKKRPGRLSLNRSRPSLIPSALKALPENPSLISETGYGQTTKGNLLDALIIMRKNPERMYKQPGSGYTINRKNSRHHKIHRIDSKILHIELLSGKLKFP